MAQAERARCVSEVHLFTQKHGTLIRKLYNFLNLRCRSDGSNRVDLIYHFKGEKYYHLKDFDRIHEDAAMAEVLLDEKHRFIDIPYFTNSNMHIVKETYDGFKQEAKNISKRVNVWGNV